MRISLKSTVQTFKLESDVDGLTTVIVRQARTGDLVRIDELFSRQTQVWNDEDIGGDVKLEREFNMSALKRERAACTLVGADIEDENGNILFPSKEGRNGLESTLNRNEFIRTWDLLPPELTDELYGLVIKANPVWDFSKKGN